MKTLGILGGVGPQTTSKVYHSIIDFFRKNEERYPAIIIYNMPFPFAVEDEAIVEGKNSEKMLPYLIEGAQILEKSGAFFGILPCNTLHKFIEDIRRSVNIPFLSILDETASKLKSLNIKKVGVLATATSVKEKLYEDVLKREGLEILYPSNEEQDAVNKIIVELLNDNVDKKQASNIQMICSALMERGAESILLACTDLQILLPEIDKSIPIVDTTNILIEAAQREMLG